MNEHATPPPAPPASESLRPVACLELKAAALLLFTLLLIVGSGLYLLYARGVFEPTQTVILTPDDSEGVVVGMDMTFSGFPIGRVRRIELASAGHARILVDVPRKDAHWLRTSSVFTLVRGLVGGANIRAYSGILSDPPLPDGAERPVLGGDVGAEVPRLLSAARGLLNNLTPLTPPQRPPIARRRRAAGARRRCRGRGSPAAVCGARSAEQPQRPERARRRPGQQPGADQDADRAAERPRRAGPGGGGGGGRGGERGEDKEGEGAAERPRRRARCAAGQCGRCPPTARAARAQQCRAGPARCAARQNRRHGRAGRPAIARQR